MLTFITFLTAIIILAIFTFAYHYERNGNPLSWGQFFSRLFWALFFAFGYAVLSQEHINWWVSAAMFPLQLISITIVPAAFAQNSGTWPAPWSVLPWYKRWPGLWLPSYTQMQWTGLSATKKCLLDFLGMTTAGLFRGGLVFLPPVYLGANLTCAIIATVVVGLGHGVSYFIGEYVPFNIWDNSANSSEWGEFGLGLVWELGVIVSLGFKILI